jgi:hypothetical protein
MTTQETENLQIFETLKFKDFQDHQTQISEEFQFVCKFLKLPAN